MPSRYYFLSSLPMLKFQDSAPLSYQSFLKQAKGNISEGDYFMLENLESEKIKNQFLKKYRTFKDNLNGAINAKRRSLLGRSKKEGDDAFLSYEIEKLSNMALNAKDPLEAEMLLLESHYNYLTEQSLYDAFSKKALLVYALKLKILIRKDLFKTESGNNEYQKMFNILQKEMKME